MPYFADPLVLRLGYSLLHFLWQGALIAFLAAVSLRFMRSADASRRYALLLCGIALMAFFPLITFFVVHLPDTNARHEPTPMVIDNDPPGIPAANHPDEPAPTDHVATTTTQPITVPVARPRPSLWMLDQEWTRRRMTPLVLAWAVGVCLLSLRVLFGWAGVLRVRRHGLSPACERIQSLSKTLCAAMPVRHTVRVCESALVQVPAVIGWLHPMILLSARLVTRLSDDELRAILAHELAHIRRHDYLVNVVQIVIENVLFYHPAVWWLSRRLRQEREHCCDDLAAAACGGNLILARALASLAELHAAAPYVLPAATGGSLVQRIRRLVQPESKSDRLVPGGLGLGLLCAIGVILAIWLFAVSAPTSADEARAVEEADDDKRNTEIDAAIQRLRQRGVFVREFHLRNDPQYWVQIQAENEVEGVRREIQAKNKVEGAVLADVAVVTRGVKLHCHLRNILLAPHDLIHLRAVGKLERLELSGHSITDEILSQLPELPLHELALGEGPYTDAGIRHIAGCRELESISLDGDAVTDECLDALVDLPKLTSVSLSSAKFTRKAFSTLEQVRNLQTLSVRANQDLDFDVSRFPNLRKIDFSGSTLDDDLARALAENCPLLEEVYFRSSSITNDGVLALAGLKHLRVLALDDSQIDDVIAVAILQMPNLEWLDLNGCPVGDATLAAAAECSRLKYLNLGRTNITDDGLAVVGKLRNMHYLALWPNPQLTDGCVPHLRQLPNYPQQDHLHIRLENTGLSREGIRELQAALPTANITPHFQE